jgi:hypothetical protein
MFSFIKYIQNIKDIFKQNKGLWFSTISVLSISGIVITMYIIMSMTSNVSEKVYKSMSKQYDLRINEIFDRKKNEFKKIAIVIANNQEFLKQIEFNNKQELDISQEKLNDTFLKNGIKNYHINVYSVLDKETILRTSVVSVIKSKNSVYGIEVVNDGVFNIYMEPLIKDDNVYGVLEIRESIHNYKSIFEAIDDEYVFLLDKNMLNKISIENKNGKYRDMIGNYTLAQEFYDTKFSATLIEIEKEKFKKLQNEGYLIDGIYYRSYKNVIDINGASVGIILSGELIDREDGFVNLADNMTKTITTVALGLVISIMLFMF